MKSDKIYVIIAGVIFSIFLVAVLIYNHRYDKKLEKMKLIEKQDSVNIDVHHSYLNRGVAFFNNKYYISSSKLIKSNDIKSVIYIDIPYKLQKKENNDTIKLTNKDTTLIMVLE